MTRKIKPDTHVSFRDDERELAFRFSRVLSEWLSHKDMEVVRRKNRVAHAKRDYSVCHSHDFCDANMAMDEAWRSLFVRAPGVQEPADASLWEAAWHIAATYGFDAQLIFGDAQAEGTRTLAGNGSLPVPAST